MANPLSRRVRRRIGAPAQVRAAVLALAGVLGACTRFADPVAGKVITCITTADCPGGRVCSPVNRCVEPATLGTPPDLVGGVVEVSPSRGRAGTSFTVTLEATKDLAAPPRVILGLDPLAELSCTLLAGRRYACPYAATGAENGGHGGSVSIDVRLTDTAGNETARPGAGTLVLDFAPPALAARSAEPADVPRGGVIQVFFTVDEDLGATPRLLASRPLQPEGSVLSATNQPGTRNWLFTHYVADQDGSGPVTFAVDLVDAVGNTTTDVEVGSVNVDVIPPVISPLRVSPPRISRTGTLTVTFDTDEPPFPGSVVAKVGGRPMSCQSTGPLPTYTCTRPMVGDEIPPGSEAAQSIVVDAVDVAGNRSTVSASTVFDFRPPGVSRATVAYTPAATNPLPQVGRATAGTIVTVTALADEELDTSVPMTLLAGLGPDTFALARVAASSTATSTVFEGPVPAVPDGDYVATLTWTDLAGNTNATSAGVPVIQVKTSTPTLSIDQSQVTYVRSPWGNAADEALGAFTIPAGPYFALAPVDPLSALPSLPPWTFTTPGGAPTAIRVWSDAARSALLGTVFGNPDGTWPRARLQNVDVPAIWITAVDDAGNESAPQRIENVEWVSTPAPGAVGTNPHVVRKTAAATSTRAQASSLDVAAADVQGADGVTALALSGAEWIDRTAGVAPPARYWTGAAYDAARGKTVVFGGTNDQNDGQYLGDTFEYDGRAWRALSVDGPSPRARYGPVMAYDGARNRVVLFGGATGGGEVDDTWEWDGSGWRDVTTATPGPAPRQLHAGAYDSRRELTVVFGGYSTAAAGPLADTWQWDGTSWASVTPVGPAPAARWRHAVAYDASRDRLVLFGGVDASGALLGDVWEWDGWRWSQRFPAGSAPSARRGHALAYDAVRKVVVLFGGFDGTNDLQDTWVWNGTTWSSVTPAGQSPAARRNHSLVWDDLRARVVLLGGGPGTGALFQDAWEWDGTSWQGAAPYPVNPGARYGHAVAYDSGRSRVVAFGGGSSVGYPPTTYWQDTWEWDGVSWRNVTPATPSPSARFLHAMAYDPNRKRVVLFGGGTIVNGTATYLQDTWEWDGATWTAMPAVGAPPSARYGHAMTYDVTNKVILLFGGYSDATRYLSDTWTWDGTTWRNVTPSSGSPPRRYGHTLVRDAARARAVVFGGYNDLTGYLHDTWEWDEINRWWTPRYPGVIPPARYDHAALYDSDRGRTLVFGGYNPTGLGLDDVWEWDGTGWTSVTPPGAGPSGRSWLGAAYDPEHHRAVMVGGYDVGRAPLPDTWELDASPQHQPAFQSDVSFQAASISAASVTGLRVRAFGGGTSAEAGLPVSGVTLHGWARKGPGNEPGTWVPLAVNATPAGGASLVAWTSSTPGEARRFVTERDSHVAFQVRPTGTASAAAVAGAAVSLDYAEVRVRYTPFRRACPVPHGTGTQSWNGSAWDACVLAGCDAGFVVAGGACVLPATSCGDLVETGISADWSSYASDAATTVLSVLSAPDVVRGQSALRAVTLAGYDFALVLTAPEGTTVDASGAELLRFAIRGYNTTPYKWQISSPVVVLQDVLGNRRQYAPASNLLNWDGVRWVGIEVPLAGGPSWSVSGQTVDLSALQRIEVHTDTWDFGFTLDLDAMSFDQIGAACPIQ
jgi:hypothetical protein